MQSALADIATPRLLLRLMGIEAVESILNGSIIAAEDILKVKVPRELLENASSLNYTRTELQKDSSYLPWSVRAIISKEHRQMIGIIRFHSGPKPIDLPGCDGVAVEFGYRVFSKYRNNGYAKESVQSMMDWAQLHFGINRFLASVSPENIISNRLISSFGFVKVAEMIDEIDGIEYVFLREGMTDL